MNVQPSVANYNSTSSFDEQLIINHSSELTSVETSQYNWVIFDAYVYIPVIIYVLPVISYYDLIEYRNTQLSFGNYSTFNNNTSYLHDRILVQDNRIDDGDTTYTSDNVDLNDLVDEEYTRIFNDGVFNGDNLYLRCSNYVGDVRRW